MVGVQQKLFRLVLMVQRSQPQLLTLEMFSTENAFSFHLVQRLD